MTSYDGYPIRTRPEAEEAAEADRKLTEQALRAREAILEAAAFTAEHLLQTASWEDGIDAVLHRLGTAAGADRAYLFVNHRAGDGDLLTSLRYEWCATGVAPQLGNPLLRDASYQEIGFERWEEILAERHVLAAALEDMPEHERPVLEAQNIRSLAVVPVHVGNAWWGFVGLDDCRASRVWQEAEVGALRIAANVLGSAVERQRQEEALRELNASLEERIATRTRRLEEANARLREAEQALRESNERLQSILENAAVGIVVGTPDRSFLDVNQTFCDLVGYTRDEIRQRPAEDFAHPEDRELTRRAALRLLRGEARYITFERRFVHKNGHALWTNVSASLLRDEAGTPKFFVVIVQDVEERKHAEEALHALNDQLEERVQQRTAQVRALASALTLAEQQERHRVARILHDDLQQQLYAVYVHIGLLQRTMTTNPEALPDRLQRISQLVTDAITATRRLTVDLSPPVLQGEGLVEALHWLSTQMEEMHRLRVTVDAPAPITVLPQNMRVLLFQLVRELLFNVVKHARVDEARVRLSQEGPQLTIEVSDDGSGFDAERTLREMPPDRGFGLFSVRERLDLFGGRLDVRTAPGQGARLTISVPLSAAEAARPPGADPATPLPA